MSLGGIFYRDVDGFERRSSVKGALSLSHMEDFAAVCAAYSNAHIYQVTFSVSGDVVSSPHAVGRREFDEPGLEVSSPSMPSAVDEDYNSCEVIAGFRFRFESRVYQLGIFAPKVSIFEPHGDVRTQRIVSGVGNVVAEALGTATGRAGLVFTDGKTKAPRVQRKWGW